jgi:hypothetical protein
MDNRGHSEEIVELRNALSDLARAERDTRAEYQDLYITSRFGSARAQAWRKMKQCGDHARRLLKSTNEEER